MNGLRTQSPHFHQGYGKNRQSGIVGDRVISQVYGCHHELLAPDLLRRCTLL